MGRYEYSRRYRSRRRRRKFRRMLPVILGCMVAIPALGGIGVYGWLHRPSNGSPDNEVIVSLNEAGSADMPGAGEDADGLDSLQEPEDVKTTETSEETPAGLELLLAQADLLAAGYDYEAAISLLESDADYASEPEVLEAAANYEAIQQTLVPAKIKEVTHVFFHSLIADPEKAFDGDEDTPGYNQVMTTIDEFNKILQILYEKGYVLVRLHDMAYETTDENGQAVMKPGTILLPEGKIPFVMSQDDLCYYPYMDGDGFATRIVIGEDGYPTCEMRLDDGSVALGDYDLVPILEHFIQEHPDFSYRGARAVLAFTGYEGVMGYRTAASYAQTNPDYEQDREEVKKIAQCLKDRGWELASHSWGHLDLGEVEWERFKADCDKWENEVDSLIGPIDIILYPFGADINNWLPYENSNERYNYLYNCGFRYFCNVDSNPFWVQIGDDYMRQGRRNLDGYRMWKDITAEAEGRERKLADLFQAEEIFDSRRPTPVPEM